MNPDGSYLGHLRTNAAGKDLNRQWDTYDNQATAPEVYYVRQAILKTGAAAVFDIHGDETNPYVFPDGRGVGCSPNPEMLALEAEFLEAYIAVSPALQRESKYEPDLPGQADLSLARAFFAERLNCLSFILEMPNKERITGEDWTAQDCKRFGANLIHPLMQLMPKLENKTLMDKVQAPRGLSFLEELRKAQAAVAPVVEDATQQNGRGMIPGGCCTIS